MYFVGEHWDHDASSSDVGDPERYHVPSAMRDFEDKDREAFLSNSGRDMKNILTKVKESEKKVQVNVPLISALVCLMREVQSLSYSRKDLSKSYVWELKNSV